MGKQIRFADNSQNRYGNIVILTLAFLFLFAFLAAALSLSSRREYHQTFRSIDQTLAFLVAQSLLAEAEAEIRAKANTDFKPMFLDFEQRKVLNLSSTSGPETRLLQADLNQIDPPGAVEMLPWNVEIEYLEAQASIYKSTASIPFGNQQTVDRVRLVRIEAKARVSGVEKEVFCIFPVKVVDVRPLANEFVNYTISGNFKGFAPSDGLSRGLGKPAVERFDKMLNHKGKALNNFPASDLNYYLNAAYRITSDLSYLYHPAQPQNLYVDGVAYVHNAHFKADTLIKYPSMIVSRNMVSFHGGVKYDTVKAENHNAHPRLSVVAENALVRNNQELQLGMNTIYSFESQVPDPKITGNLCSQIIKYDEDIGFSPQTVLNYDPAFIDPARGFLVDRVRLEDGSFVQGCYVVTISPIPVLWTDRANMEI